MTREEIEKRFIKIHAELYEKGVEAERQRILDIVKRHKCAVTYQGVSCNCMDSILDEIEGNKKEEGAK